MCIGFLCASNLPELTKAITMKLVFTLLVTLFFIPLSGAAQLGVINKLKDKAKQRVNQHIDQGMDKSLDQTEESIKKSAKAKSKDEKENKETVAEGRQAEKMSTNVTAVNAAPVSFKSYSQYDFVPGEQIVYAEDFEQDVVGEFPLKWFTNNRGETVVIEGLPNKWMRMFQKGYFLSPPLKQLPDNFTIEFDMAIHFDLKEEEKGYVYPNVSFHLLEMLTSDVNGRSYFQNKDALVDAAFLLYPGVQGESLIGFNCEEKGSTFMSNPQKVIKHLDSYNGKPFHVAIWVQKERIRCWINGEKVYDIPKALPAKSNFNRISFDIPSSSYDEEKLGMYVSNIKIAQGAPDLRSKLITEGKWVTNGILFDVNSDKVKPESFGVIKEIATVLKDNPTVKVKIVGHTDADGDAAKNLELSKRRSAAVKNLLEAEFKIDASRLQTDGLGESKPVADNTTKEGKLQNRRVEFIKL